MAKLSKEAYNRFCSYLGSGKADDIAKMVTSLDKGTQPFVVCDG